MQNSLTKEQFLSLYQQLQVSPLIDPEVVFEAYEIASEGANELSESNLFGKTVPINQLPLILYLINEFGFFLESHQVDCKSLKGNEEVLERIVSLAVDKYFTNEHLNYKNNKILTKYSPVISNLDLYLNFMFGMLARFPKNNPNETLVLDVMHKGFSIMKSILDLVVDGFGTEAFSLWRTLHENECILYLLNKYGTPIQNSYVKHLKYGVAFRGGIKDKTEDDKIFSELKEEMRTLDLKSKDMKKYIEYGWLTAVPNFNEDKQFKFNFRDGVERLAELSAYSKLYEMASEISHSSPILIYSKDEYYLRLVLLTVYECFFRYEKIFSEFYLSRISKEEAERYSAMKKTYYSILFYIYNREKQRFQKTYSKRQEK